MDWRPLVKIQPCIVHAGADRHGRGGEFLHLLHLDVILLEPVLQIEGIFCGGAGVANDDIGDDLPLDSSFIYFGKILLAKVFKTLDRGLAHQLQDRVRAMLWSQLQPASCVFLGDGGDVAAISQSHIMADSAGDEDMLDLG